MSRRDVVFVLLTRLEAKTLLYAATFMVANLSDEELLETFPGHQAPAIRRALRKLAKAIEPADE